MGFFFLLQEVWYLFLYSTISALEFFKNFLKPKTIGSIKMKGLDKLLEENLFIETDLSRDLSELKFFKSVI